MVRVVASGGECLFTGIYFGGPAGACKRRVCTPSLTNAADLAVAGQPSRGCDTRYGRGSSALSRGTMRTHRSGYLSWWSSRPTAGGIELRSLQSPRPILFLVAIEAKNLRKYCVFFFGCRFYSLFYLLITRQSNLSSRENTALGSLLFTAERLLIFRCLSLNIAIWIANLRHADRNIHKLYSTLLYIKLNFIIEQKLKRSWISLYFIIKIYNFIGAQWNFIIKWITFFKFSTEIF